MFRLEGEVPKNRQIITKWHDDARLSLTNARIGAIQTRTQAASWPKALDLNGLVYERLLDSEVKNGFSAVQEIGGADWYIDWLSRDRKNPAQPYQQLAKVLRDAGADPSATRILYTRRKLDQRQASVGAATMLLLQEWIVGYGLGFGYFRSLLWVAFFTSIGTAFLWSNLPASLNKNVWWCAFASFDEILPLVELRKEHAEIVEKYIEEPWMKYFYFQRIVGYVLGSFIIAGLAGLTQPSSKH